MRKRPKKSRKLPETVATGFQNLEAEEQQYILCKQHPLHFANEYIMTYDEVDANHKLYPDFPYLETVMDKFIVRENRYWLKSQRMLITISFCMLYLWDWLFNNGVNSLWIGKHQGAVDDGGAGSTWNSAMGKMRFMYDNLPGWLKEVVLGRMYHSSEFTKYTRIINPKNGNTIIGQAPTVSAGVGEGFKQCVVDEVSSIRYMETIHANLTQSCKYGRHYVSFPLGRNNFFAKLHFRPGHFGFKQEEVPYELNPNYTPEWFAEQERLSTKFVIAQRLLRSFEESTQGKVWDKFDFNKNVGDFKWIQGLPIYLFWDFGFKDATSVGFAQKPNDTRLRIFDWFEGNFMGYRDISKTIRGMLAKYDIRFEVIGKDSEGFDKFRIQAGHIEMFGDPSVSARRETGKTLQEKYEEQGLQIESCDSHNTIIILDKIDDALEASNLEIDSECEPIIQSMRYLEWPKNAQGEPKPGVTQPNHDQFSHAGKALEYGFTMTMAQEDAADSIKKYRNQSKMVKKSARPVLDYSDI